MRPPALARFLAGSAALAGAAAVGAPVPSGAQVLQTLTISKAVDGDTDVEEFDFTLACELGTPFEFTLTEGESIVIEDAIDLGVSFSTEIECTLKEFVTGEQPTLVTAEGVAITPDPDSEDDDGAPRTGRAELPFLIIALADPGDATAGWRLVTYESPSIIGYEVEVTNLYAEVPPPPSVTTSSSTTSSLATTTTTAAVRSAAVVPRFTG